MGGEAGAWAVGCVHLQWCVVRGRKCWCAPGPRTLIRPGFPGCRENKSRAIAMRIQKGSKTVELPCIVIVHSTPPKPFCLFVDL